MAQFSVENDFAQVLDSIRPHLHPQACEIVEGLLQVGELRVAAEHLCELLCEDEVSLPAGAHGDLMRLLLRIRMGLTYIKSIPEPIPG
jgi:hypothetical protein